MELEAGGVTVTEVEDSFTVIVVPPVSVVVIEFPPLEVTVIAMLPRDIFVYSKRTSKDSCDDTAYLLLDVVTKYTDRQI